MILLALVRLGLHGCMMFKRCLLSGCFEGSSDKSFGTYHTTAVLDASPLFSQKTTNSSTLTLLRRSSAGPWLRTWNTGHPCAIPWNAGAPYTSVRDLLLRWVLAQSRVLFVWSDSFCFFVDWWDMVGPNGFKSCFHWVLCCIEGDVDENHDGDVLHLVDFSCTSPLVKSYRPLESRSERPCSLGRVTKTRFTQSTINKILVFFRPCARFLVDFLIFFGTMFVFCVFPFWSCCCFMFFLLVLLALLAGSAAGAGGVAGSGSAGAWAAGDLVLLALLVVLLLLVLQPKKLRTPAAAVTPTCCGADGRWFCLCWWCCWFC